MSPSRMAATVLVLATCLHRLVARQARRGARHARPPIRRVAAPVPRTVGAQAARLLSGIVNSRLGRHAARVAERGMAPVLRLSHSFLDSRLGRLVTQVAGRGMVPGLPVPRSLAASLAVAIIVTVSVLATQLGGPNVRPATQAAGNVTSVYPLETTQQQRTQQQGTQQQAPGQQGNMSSATAPQRSAGQNLAQGSGTGQAPPAQQGPSANYAGAKRAAAGTADNGGHAPQGKPPAAKAAPRPAPPPVWNQLLPAAIDAPQQSMPVGSDQWQNAKTIVDEALAMHMGTRSAVIAVATAMQESKLENLDYGDEDSLGLFQQRPSAGWGSPDQITNPQYAAWAFLNALWQYQRSNPGWATQALWMAAQGVQQSAFPSAYEQWEQEAAYIVWKLGG